MSNRINVINFQKEIDRFVEDILSYAPGSAYYDRFGKIPAIQLDKLFIYIYPPHTTRQLPKKNLQTIHIDVDLLQASGDKVRNRIKGMLGLGPKVFARNTVAARLDKKVALAFQEEHHLQVALPGKYRYGLFDKGELVSVAVFSGGRRMNNKPEEYRSFELLRFCHKDAYTVVGGVSKLIQKFVQEFQPSDIMTYADLDWCQQSSLEKVGFIQLETKSPQIFWIEDGVRRYPESKTDREGYWVTNSGSLKLKLIL